MIYFAILWQRRSMVWVSETCLDFEVVTLVAVSVERCGSIEISGVPWRRGAGGMCVQRCCDLQEKATIVPGSPKPE